MNTKGKKYEIIFSFGVKELFSLLPLYLQMRRGY